RKRGAKSVIRTLAPSCEVKTVEMIAVFRKYSDEDSTTRSNRTSQNPFSSSPARRRENTGSPSKRGKHHHTIRPRVLIRAAVRQFPITPSSSDCVSTPICELLQPASNCGGRFEDM